MCAILYSYHEKGNTYMPKGTNQKLKLYRLAQIMLENTDDEHYITMPEIMEELGKYEVTADRKTIYADLRDLSVFGIEVEGEPIGNRYHYRVVNRPFELPELKLLVDSMYWLVYALYNGIYSNDQELVEINSSNFSSVELSWFRC